MPEMITSPGKTIVVWEMDEEAFVFLEEIVPSSDGFARDLRSIRRRLDEMAALDAEMEATRQGIRVVMRMREGRLSPGLEITGERAPQGEAGRD